MDDEWWPEDEEDGTPVRPSAPGRPASAPPTPDYRPLPVRLSENEFGDDLDSEPAEEPPQQIYAPTPVDGKTAVAGVPVALPPRSAPAPPRSAPAPPRSAPAPPRSAPVLPPKAPEPPQFEQVQPGQQVSPEWRHEHETPRDLPQAPESAWAQPPTAPLPIVKPPTAPPAKPSTPRAPLGVPHQVPPAPMPRPADDLARRRAERRPEPPAEMGLQGAVRRSTFGLISPSPGRREQERHADLELIERKFGALRQVTVANPAPGSGKSVAAQMLALTFGRHRSKRVLAWDIAETPGTLGLRSAAEVFHHNDFDLSATDGSTIDFGAQRDAFGSAYELIVVGTGTDPDTPDWREAIDATDQLVVTVFGSNASAEAAAKMLNYLERMGRARTARQAVTILALPQYQRDLDAAGIERHFAARTRVVVRIPYDRAVEARPIDFRQLADATHTAWIKAAAAVAEGL